MMVDDIIYTVILGTSLLHDQERNKKDSVLHYTRPVDGWVQLSDTYHTFSIVKAGTDCPGHGYLFVELSIDKMNPEPIRETNSTSHSWNINVTSECIGNGIHRAELNITFDNATFYSITEKLNEANESSITVQFIYKNYITSDKYPSPSANIHLRHNNSQPDHHNEVGSSPLCTTSTMKPGGSVTETSPGFHFDANSFSVTSSSSSLKLDTANLHSSLSISLLITLLYHNISS